MRILVGSEEGLRIVRWLEGEKAGTVESRGFDGLEVAALVSAGDGDILAAVPERGLFRSDDGVTWEPLVDRLDGGRIRALVAAPSGTIVAGTEPAGLHVSRDGGATWKELGSFAALEASEDWSDYGERAAHVAAIALDPHDAVDPRDGSRVYAATGGGLFVSHDRGAAWRAVDGELGDRYCLRFFALASTPVSGPAESLFLVGTAAGPPSTWGKRATESGAQLWASLDSGRTWGALEEHGTRDTSPATVLEGNPRNAQAVLAGTAQGHLLYGHLTEQHWHQIMYGLGAVRSLLVF
jgi:photosystem II stability/assembly factor-like uncharacterized protein